MILLFLFVIFHFDLRVCDEFEQAPTLPLKTDHGHKPPTTNDFSNTSTTNSWSNSTQGMETRHQTLLSSRTSNPISTRNSSKDPSRAPDPIYPKSAGLPSDVTHLTAHHTEGTTSIPNPAKPAPKSSFNGNHTPASSHLLLSTGAKQELLAGGDDGVHKSRLLKDGGDRGVRRDSEAPVKAPWDGQLDEKMMTTSGVFRKMLDPVTVATPTPQYLLFLHTAQPTPAASYAGLLRTLREGYMISFLVEFTRLMTEKEQQAVFEVIRHTDEIIRGYYKKDELLWFGQPLIYVTKKVGKMFKDSNMKVTLDSATQMHNMFSKRQEEMTPESNAILEYADKQFTEDDGKVLIGALKEFAAYPNITLTGYLLCNRLIISFLRPFRRMDAEHRRKLMDSVNLELTKRFNANETTSLSGDKEYDGSSAQEENITEIELWPQIELVTTPKELLTTQKKLETSRKEPVTTSKEVETTCEELETTRKELISFQTERTTTKKEPATQKKRLTKKEVSSEEEPTSRTEEIDKSKEIVALKKLIASEKLDTSEEIATLKKLVSSKQIVSPEELALLEELGSSEKPVSKKKHGTPKEKHKTTKSSRKKKKKQSKRQKKEKKSKKEKKNKETDRSHKSTKEFDIFRADNSEEDSEDSESAYADDE